LTTSSIFITTVGLVVVGAASLMEDRASGNMSKMLLGNALVVAGQFANAVQFIVEEVFF